MQINDNEKEYEGLTERQKQAVKHDDGNALVSASAGAGKTTVVIKRILRLIEKENGVHYVPKRPLKDWIVE